MISLNKLAYALPAFGVLQAVALNLPQAYVKYEKTAESPHSKTVKAVVKRVLSANHQNQERIQEMLDELPDSVGAKNIDSLINTRFKVIALKHKLAPIYATGTDDDSGDVQGKFYIGIAPDIDETAKAALPWIAIHELCHCLEMDHVGIKMKKAAVTTVAVSVVTFGFGWTLWPAIGAAFVANIATHVIASHHAENRADDFANKYSAPDERENAIVWLEKIRDSKTGGIVKYIDRMASRLLHPSEESRIAKIRESFKLA